MKKFIIVLVGFICVFYVGIIYITGSVIESNLADSQKFIETSDSPLLKGMKLSYENESSGLYERTGKFLIDSPLFGKSVCPTTISTGFLHANVKMTVDELLSNLSQNDLYLPSSLDRKTVKGHLDIDVNVLVLKAQAIANITSKYLNKKYKDLSVNLVAKADSSFKPEAKLDVISFKNPKLFSCDSLNYVGNIEGLFSITSLGVGKVKGTNLVFSNQKLNTLDAEYRTYEYENDIFKLHLNAIGNGVTDYLSSFNFEGALYPFDLNKILYTDNYRKNKNDESLDIILSDMEKVIIDRFDFSFSKKFANKLFSERSSEIPFFSNGEFSLKYATLPKSLNGVIHLSTKSQKGLAFLLKDKGNGLYGTDLTIKNGDYQIGDFSFTPDFLKSTAISGLFEKIKLDKNLDKTSDKISKGIDKLDESIKKSGIFNLIK